MMSETSSETIGTIFTDLRRSFNAGTSKSLAWRKNQIMQLYKMCDEQQEVFASAAFADFHRPTAETYIYDCGVVCTHLIDVLLHFIRQ
jgi:hypothetical protein